MNEIVLWLLDTAGAYHLEWWLLSAAIVLVLIDAFFPTDWPARLSYLLAAAGIFFIVPLTPLASLGVALALWAVLELLHRFAWGEYLRNAPEDQEPPRADAVSSEQTTD